MLAESEVGVRKEANRKRMRSPTIKLSARTVRSRLLECRCPVAVARTDC
jgi:hypothetical protein